MLSEIGRDACMDVAPLRRERLWVARLDDEVGGDEGLRTGRINHWPVLHDAIDGLFGLGDRFPYEYFMVQRVTDLGVCFHFLHALARLGLGWTVSAGSRGQRPQVT